MGFATRVVEIRNLDLDVTIENILVMVRVHRFCIGERYFCGMSWTDMAL